MLFAYVFKMLSRLNTLQHDSASNNKGAVITKTGPQICYGIIVRPQSKYKWFIKDCTSFNTVPSFKAGLALFRGMPGAYLSGVQFGPNLDY